ncbi:MAG: TetR/AcrR family transcriptional regulator [Proteobacteria bacterium]|nr:TetR/AcrR family transcriptional regulator [Pseudomonadota bacterium]
MARKTRSPEVVEKIKDHIIGEAMKLIIDIGFNNMSMRKLAQRLGMSPTNIYYYYASQDEIYLNIQIKGFKALQTLLEKTSLSEKDPYLGLKKIIRAYLEFGFTHPDYYQIMLNSDTPRYLEYKGDKIEPIALMAKQMAIDAITVPLRVIEKICTLNPDVPKQDIQFRAYQIWITLHGMVTLNNRNILQELEEIPEKLINRMCEELMLPFYSSQTNSNEDTKEEDTKNEDNCVK